MDLFRHFHISFGLAVLVHYVNFLISCDGPFSIASLVLLCFFYILFIMYKWLKRRFEERHPDFDVLADAEEIIRYLLGI